MKVLAITPAETAEPQSFALAESDDLIESQKSQALKLTDWLMTKAFQGFGPLTSVENLAAEYLGDERYRDHHARVDSLIRWETSKNFTTGFLTGFGGFATLPVTIPAALGSSLVVQLRLVATIAKIYGYDITASNTNYGKAAKPPKGGTGVSPVRAQRPAVRKPTVEVGDPRYPRRSIRFRQEANASGSSNRSPLRLARALQDAKPTQARRLYALT